MSELGETDKSQQMLPVLLPTGDLNKRCRISRDGAMHPWLRIGNYVFGGNRGALVARGKPNRRRQANNLG
jgi:hypothetical protein